ncbi:tRNA dihydrouridine synthase DusB [Candidatus Parcubacteria bacterium]|nr:MAG: tRNA dihydrouridine synthase DusB [Candidatus Parcubacteria bacterium]
MKFNWKETKKPILALSPMADMTDSPFALTVHNLLKANKQTSRLIIFREMVSSEAIVRGNEKTLQMAAINDLERPIIQQIFGARPDIMAEAAKIIEEKFKPEGIDINMGCPSYKLTGNFNGAALMKNPELAAKIVKTVKKAVNLPISVKMRAGWSNHEECIEFSRRIEDAGADLISIHGRTQKQGYAGHAHRDVVAKAKKTVKIPVLYNGDIFTWNDYFTAIKETKTDGALIARGALGNPWIFMQIEEKISGKNPQEISIKERARVAEQHFLAHIDHYGEKALPTFRKHLTWYFKGIPNFKNYKQKLMTAIKKEEVISILQEISNQFN